MEFKKYKNINLRMDNILITGGAGYLGSHACLNLLEAGYGIYIVDSLENSSFESISRVIDTLKKKINFLK